MSLPPSFLDELRARLTLSDVVGRKVTWDRRKSNPGKGDFWAPCPFHQEKTPSFHVDDRKGFYYCFGCQAKGDLITFVKESENLDFMEAVERLAAEAGMEMPRREADPRAAERRDRASRMIETMEEAARLFGLAFRAGMGQMARDYAERRGLSAETLKRFEIGYAPDNRHYLTRAFREKGSLREAVAAGLVIEPDDGGEPFDRFRGRLMFPIRDPRGRCIAFGARALLPSQQAKYLNSPETELFHKGRTLFNHGPAREAAGKTGRLIVAEGYMDVIALVAAGFEHAVAPLGTAITEDQLQLLWRMAPEPVIALDGDAAGLRAAYRVMELALPHLAPGRSLRFCLMPPGRDPDDLIREGGPAAMQAVLDAALPMVEMLWRHEVGEGALDTPEARAGFDGRLRAALGRIADQAVREHYRADIRQRRAELFRPQRPAAAAKAPRKAARAGQAAGGGRGRPAPFEVGGPQPGTRNSDLARAGTQAVQLAARIREAAILLIACHNPGVLAAMEAEFEAMTLTAPEHAAVREAMLDAMAVGAADELAAHVAQRCGFDPVEFLARVPQARAHPLARPGQAPERVREVLAEAIGRHAVALAFEAERADACRDLVEAEDEAWTHRLRRAGAEVDRLERELLGQAPTADGERPSPIQEMLDREVYRAKKR
ncbi:DNA primase [Limibaculum sp. M0105]|uniref:DNA primase n=1 Tax=Thermohalobaculum xanthum TaxID=2753746 RepID=A0A8J7MBI1_9RHOB|nr:DNA primase [Thermohalobaculum xanthum]MBK0401124.1 DNA primase [Thermohalobaculum xanthum]